MNFLNLNHTYINDFRDKLSFDLFLYDVERCNRIFALKSNQQLTDAKFEEIQKLCIKGLVLQFKDEHLESFKELNIWENVFRDNQKQIELKKNEKNNLMKKVKLEDFDFKASLKESVESRDFTPLLLRASTEISYFSIRESQEQSNLIEFISSSLTRDSSLTRGAAFCYFFCKSLGLAKEFDILEILAAYLLKDVGLSQLPINNLSTEDYSKHPSLSTMIVRRSQFVLSNSISRMIMESHERHDGLGFPLGKKEEYIHIGSRIVNLCDYIIDNTYKVEPKVNFYTCLKSVVNGRSLNNEVRKYPEDFILTLKRFI